MRFVVFILVSIAIHAAVLNLYFVQKNNVPHTEQVIIQVGEEELREAVSASVPIPPAPALVDIPASERKAENETVVEADKIQSVDSFSEKNVIPVTSAVPVVIPPELETQPKPVYSVSERKAGHEGSVFISIAVGADGSLLNAAVKKSSGYKALDRAALASVKKCSLKPGLCNGVPHESSLVIEVVFRLK